MVVEFLTELQSLAGGATETPARGRSRGVWMGIEDFSVRFEVGLAVERTDHLVALLERYVQRFGQECLYAVLPDGRAVLVYPKSEA